MTLATPATDFPSVPRPRDDARAHAVRDPRLDFFRGLAMVVILVAHVPGNAWGSWIPGRWGFSDATEIFVFCSGMASAIAFGGTFARAGWWLGTARVAYRLWQIYWAHVGMFLALFVLLAAVDAGGLNPERHNVGSLNLWKVLSEPAQALTAFATLRWVPNYFDILPMYMCVLAMTPLVVALARVSLPAVAALSLTVWLLAQGAWLDAAGLGAWHLALPAEPWSDRTWFFNPFGWQLVFFTGFAFLRGWLPPPPVTPRLVGLAVAVLVASAAVSSVGFRLWETAPLRAAYVAATGCVETGFGACNPVFDWRQANAVWYAKSDLSLPHYLHFLALAYVAWAAAGSGGSRLVSAGADGWARARAMVVGTVIKVGQQSLAVFVFAMVFSRVMGIALDLAGRSPATLLAVNLTGIVALIACAHVAGWFKAQPWRAAR